MLSNYAEHTKKNPREEREEEEAHHQIQK